MGRVLVSHRNQRQRRRAIWFCGRRRARHFYGCSSSIISSAGTIRHWLKLLRKAGEGIGWIFQMGMGYTFYLPFAFYMAGLLVLVLYGDQVDHDGTLGRVSVSD